MQRCGGFVGTPAGSPGRGRAPLLLLFSSCLPVYCCYQLPSSFIHPPFLSLATEFVARQGVEAVTHAEIVAAVKPQARPRVPDNVKAELLKRIREILEK